MSTNNESKITISKAQAANNYRLLLTSLEGRVAAATKARAAFIAKLQESPLHTLEWHMDSLVDAEADAAIAAQLANVLKRVADGSVGVSRIGQREVTFTSTRKWLLTTALSAAALPYNGSGNGARLISAAKAKAAAALYRDLFEDANPSDYGE